MKIENDFRPEKPDPLPVSTEASTNPAASNMPSTPPAAPAGSDLQPTISDTADATAATDAAAKNIATPGKTATPQPRAMALAMKKKLVLDGITDYAISPKHGKSYAVMQSNGYIEALAIGSQELNARIRTLIRKKGESIKQRELDDLNEELKSQAEATGKRAELYPRAHPLTDGGVEIDLCDGAGTTVRVNAGKVEILHGTSPTLFIRSATAMALPLPAERGDFTRMKKYVNLQTYAFMVYVALLTFTIAHPKIESTKYVFLVLKGTEGSGKTFASKCSQKLVDPRSIGAQTLPGNERELAIVLQSTHLLVVDNLRDISPAMSDLLCIASTGGAVGLRKLYTDDEQKALYLHGQIMFNGIHPFMGQSDFADRCLVLDLQPIQSEMRKSETAMLAEFEADRPIILRGLYDLIAKALECLPAAKVTHPARMLDFCRWLGATEMAMGAPDGSLQQFYVDNLREAKLETLLDNPLAVTILEFVHGIFKSANEWIGTPTQFYEKLETIAAFSNQRSRAWPTSAAVMSKRLHGLQAPLMAQGISLELARGKDRQIVVRKLGTYSAPTDVAADATTDSLIPVAAGTPHVNHEDY